MVARSVVTLGVSTERGAVHAVALADSGEKLPERVLFQRVVKTQGETKADVAAAVETALEALAAAIGPDREIGGVAVTYRDAAERRAIVTKLAAGQWRTASMVSAKSAHLSVAGVMTWLDEFDDLLICEVVPGYQAFTLIDRRRTRVLAATSQAGGATADLLGAAVTAAWDQFEAAAVQPSAVVLIGSGASAPAVVAAVDAFGAPVVPCKIAAAAAAVGAATFAMDDVTVVSETVEYARRARGTTALFAAASVLAGGLVAGGLYTASTSRPGAVTADARVTADTRLVDGGTGSASGSTAGSSVEPKLNPFEESDPEPVTEADPTVVQIGLIDSGPRYGMQRWGSTEDRPLRLEPSDAVHEADDPTTQLVPGSGIPGSGTTKVGVPNGSLLFPGEGAPPAAFTPESYRWWDNHLRMMVHWASQQLLLA